MTQAMTARRGMELFVSSPSRLPAASPDPTFFTATLALILTAPDNFPVSSRGLAKPADLAQAL